ncbi:MAG: peptidylprolyl isomerase [Clostridia bacterium]
MKNSKTGQRILAIVLLISIVIGSVGCGATVNKGEVVATVNGVKLYRADLDKQVDAQLATFVSMGYDLESAEVKSIIPLVQNQVLEMLIQDEIMVQTADKLKLKVEDKQVQDEYNSMETQYGKEAFAAELKKAGLTKDEYMKTLRMYALNQELYSEITKDVAVTAAEVSAYFEENKASLVEYKVNHILAAVSEGAIEADWDAAKKRAEGWIAELQKGANFVELAKKSTDEEAGKATGGDLGTVTEADSSFVQEFNDALFALKAGTYTLEPVKTSFGYHVILLREKVESFDSLKVKAEENALSAKQSKVYDEYMNNEMTTAKIERLFKAEEVTTDGAVQEQTTGAATGK